ncbi:MAG TPA: ComEC/Rec2 family competence protein [Candidatus Paceibacterota bacterium]|jgi:competence protein ComEC|nr:ComEC/Rec2 family competence protein [Candidatus Paceibacterota bacterium]
MRFLILPADLAFGIVFAFIVGAFAANLGWNSYAVLGIAAIGLAVAYADKKLARAECVLFCISLVAGIFYFHAYLSRKTESTAMPFNKEISFSAIVTDEPQPAAHSRILDVAVQMPLKGSVEILAPPNNQAQYGDLLVIKGKIEPPGQTGEAPFVYSPKITFISAHHGFLLREKMIDLKLAIIARFKSLLSADDAAFLAGVLFGAKGDISQALKGALSLTGTTHLVAVSGYKITLVILAAGTLMRRFLSRRATFLGTACCLVLYILMVGNAASAIRAAIMGFITLVAKETGEEFNMRNAIAFTACIMVLIDPTVLTEDLSFIISFLSVLGIVYLGPSLQKLFRYTEPGIFEWKHAAVTTLAAQLATMPVLVNAFGQFSFVAIPANILTLSLLPLTMFFGFGLAALGFISSHLAFGSAQLVEFILSYQLAVIRFFAAIAVPLPVSFNSAFFTGSYYCILVIFIYSYGNDANAHGDLQEI